MRRKKIINLGDGAILLYTTTKRKASAWYVGFLGGAMEDKKEGTAHFLEHMLFKGTNRRTYEDINKDKFEIASLNALTGPYFTLVEAIRTNKLTNETLEFMSDLLLNNKLSKDYIENEKGVITEELKKDIDYLKTNIGQHHYSQIYQANSNYPKTLGSYENIQSMTLEDLQEFKSRNYVKQNFILAVTTKYPVYKVKKLYKKFFEPKLMYDNNYSPLLEYSKEPSKEESLRVVHNKDMQQVACKISIVSNIGYEDYKNKTVVDYISTLLGGNTSPLYIELRSKGLIYSFNRMSSMKFNNSTIFTFGFNASVQNLKNIIDIIGKHFNEVYNNGMTQDIFDRKSRNLEYEDDEAVSTVNLLSRTRNLVYDYVEMGKFLKPYKWLREHKKLKLDHVNEFYKNVLSKDNKIYITYLGNLTEDDVYSLEETKSKLLF